MSRNSQQNVAYRAGLDRRSNVFITGPTGTGKSRVLRDLYETFIQQDDLQNAVGLTAPTNRSAVRLQGRTLHSLLSLGYNSVDVDNICATANFTLRRLKVLIIDDVQDLDVTLFTNLHAACQRVRESSEPFGGIHLVLAGDLCMMPAYGSDKPLITQSSIWETCIPWTCLLTIMHRQTDPAFIAFILAVRMGRLTQEQAAYSTRFGAGIVHQDPIQLVASRNMARDINRTKLSHLGLMSPVKEYTAEVIDGPDMSLETIFSRCQLPQTLSLAEGSRVVLLTSSHSDSLVNGSLGTVTSFSDDGYPIVTFDDDDRQVTITRDTVYPFGPSGAAVTQVPLALAHAITIHRSNGMHLDKVDVDLSEAHFNGQVYAAIAGATGPDNIIIRNLDIDSINVNPAAVAYYDWLARLSWSRTRRRVIIGTSPVTIAAQATARANRLARAASRRRQGGSEAS